MGTLKTLLHLAEQDNAGHVTKDVWSTTLESIKKEHPTEISCIKIDPMQQTVTMCALDLKVTEEDECLEMAPTADTLEHASEIPAGGMLRPSKMMPLGHLLMWTDLDLMQGGVDNNKFPGFRVRDSKTLTGKALIVKILQYETDFGHIRVFDNSSTDDLEFVRDGIQWMGVEQAADCMEQEYQERCAAMKKAQGQGLFGNTQIIYMK